MSLTLALAKQVLAAQPFSVLVGARITEFTDRTVTLEIPVRDDLRQQNGFLHGGVVAYAADNTITFAGGLALGAAVLTGGFTITYLRPATGVVLRARASVTTATARQALCRCDISVVDESGVERVCAAAQGTVVVTTPQT